MARQIPGQFITSVGGLVGFSPFGNNRTPEWGTNAPTGPTYLNSANSIDVLDWSVQIFSAFDDSTTTGSYGAVNSEKTAEGFMATINVMVDQGQPPDMLVKYGQFITSGNPLASDGTQSYGFNLGTRMTLVQGAGVNYPSDGGVIDFWYAPSVKIAVSQPVVDANNKKMVRMQVTAQGNSRIFKLPGEYQPLLSYITHLQSRNQVF